MPASGRQTRMPALQVKVTLQVVRPPIWRRLIIPGQWHLGRAHDVLQVAMGWTDSHLHEFDVAGRRYGVPDPDWDDDVQRETLVRLHEALSAPGDRISYRYDFGDSWEHTVELEALLDPATSATCLAGRRACPPEDCGGPYRYPEMLTALADPGHPEHEEMQEWIGGTFDPTAFDPADVNTALARR